MDPKEAFARAVRWVMRDTLYHAQYISTVQRQDDDGLLDLLPDDERIRGTGLSRVPIRYGIPGVTARVVVGARVTLAFEAGDPSRPFAALWDPGAVESISFNGGTARIARMGDAVTFFWPTGCLVEGLLSGNVFTGTMFITSSSVGIIADGAEKVTA
jgi:hypothetical protein